MKICVFGAGYVGLSNALVLSKNNEAVLIDIVKEKIDLINNKKSTFIDKDIDDYFKNNPSLNIRGSLDINECKNADIVIIATPTDYNIQNKYFDTSSIEDVLDKLFKINDKCIVIIKSTIPIGYTSSLIKKYNYIDIYFCPEFLKEGEALYDSLHPSRIIVGVSDITNNKGELIIDLFKEACEDACVKTLIMSLEEAESTKLFANTFLAMRISFFNELDTYASSKKLNAKNIIDGVCLDKRIGQFYNNPSFGYGGYCLPKDTKQLKETFSNIPSIIISSIVESNEIRKKYIIDDILSNIKDGQYVGIYRLNMKQGVTDFRQSSIIDILNGLKDKYDKSKIFLYEPNLAADNYLDINVIKDIDTFKNKCDLIIANRVDENIVDVMHKVYTKDVYHRD